MRVLALLPVLLLAACDRAATPPAALTAPITAEARPLALDPPWLMPQDQTAKLDGEFTSVWSFQAIVVADHPAGLKARGLPLPGEAPRVVTDLGRIAGRDIFAGVGVGANDADPRVVEGNQLHQRTFLADYQLKDGKPLPLQRVLSEGDFFQARLHRGVDGSQLLTDLHVRINRVLATTRATITCGPWTLPVEEPLVAAGDNTPLAAPLALGQDPVMVALPIRWTLLRPTAQVRAWGPVSDEQTTPIAETAMDEALVAIVLVRPVDHGGASAKAVTGVPKP